MILSTNKMVRIASVAPNVILYYIGVALLSARDAASFQLAGQQTSRRQAAVGSTTFKIDQEVVAGPLKPLTNYVLIAVDADSSSTLGGIILSDKAKEKAQTGTVVTVGPGKQHKETGVRLPIAVEGGDRVLWGRYDGARIKYCDADHTLLKDTDLVLAWGEGGLNPQPADLRALKGNVLIKVAKNAGETSGGILLGAAAADDIPLQGTVVAVGDGTPTKDGTVVVPPVSVGDSVRFRDYDATELTIDGEDHVALSSQHIICKWTA